MPDDRLIKSLELFARIIGVGTAVGGLALLPSAPVLGIPLIAVGLLFAVRPATAGELLHIAASIV